jgi:hypothetical protein
MTLTLVLATGCPEDTKDTGDSGDSGDTGDTDTGDPLVECETGVAVDIDGTSYTLAIDGLQVITVSANLAATGFQPFTADSCDFTSGDNLLNVFQTGVTDLANGWDEEHVLPSTSFSDATTTAPNLDHLELAITHVETIGELTGDDKTLFNTDDDGGLTYALRIFNDDGTLADCVVWGHDVPGMFNGDVPTNNTDGPTDVGDITTANCATLD